MTMSTSDREYRKLKIGIDVDDVCWDLVTPWLEYYKNNFADKNEDVPSKIEIKSYNIDNYIKSPLLWQVLKERLFWESFDPKSQPIYKKTKNMLKCLHNNPLFDIYFVSSTSLLTPNEKWKKFFECFPFVKQDKVILTPHKELVDLDVLIDDCFDNIEKFTQYNPNRYGLLYTQPWNVWYLDYTTTNKLNYTSKIYRISNINDIEYILKLINCLY